jgi:hypothetical protein
MRVASESIHVLPGNLCCRQIRNKSSPCRISDVSFNRMSSWAIGQLCSWQTDSPRSDFSSLPIQSKLFTQDDRKAFSIKQTHFLKHAELSQLCRKPLHPSLRSEFQRLSSLFGCMANLEFTQNYPIPWPTTFDSFLEHAV